jgi:serine/threonine protein kinase
MGSAEGLHYLVMEYLEGETLEDVLLRRKQFPPPEAVRLIYQALLGLQHIHEQGLVHRDLKPANLMLVPPPVRDNTTACTVKILDIGLGRVFFEESGETQEPGLTSEGVLLGTPDYMAPEQARDPRSTDIRADVYSLGCVLYHLLTGQTPFPDTNIISQMIKHATEPARPLREFNKDVPDGLQQIVNWMMAKETAGRYPTPERAAKALEVFLAAGNTPASSPDLDPQMQPYLNWVEAENRRNPPPSGHAIPTSHQLTAPMIAVPAPPGTRPPSGTIPTASPVASAGTGEKPRARPEQAEKRDRDRGEKRKEHKQREKKKTAEPAVTGERPAAAPNAFDVELVEMPAGRAESKRKREGMLTRRDFVMFFAGVGVTVLAFFVGWGLATLMK